MRRDRIVRDKETALSLIDSIPHVEGSHGVFVHLDGPDAPPDDGLRGVYPRTPTDLRDYVKSLPNDCVTAVVNTDHAGQDCQVLVELVDGSLDGFPPSPQ